MNNGTITPLPYVNNINFEQNFNWDYNEEGYFAENYHEAEITEENDDNIPSTSSADKGKLTSLRDQSYASPMKFTLPFGKFF